MTNLRKALVCVALAGAAMGLGGGVAMAGGKNAPDAPRGHECILKNGETGTYTYHEGHRHFHCLPKQ